MHLIKKYILLFVNSWEILKEYSYLGISSSEEIAGKEKYDEAINEIQTKINETKENLKNGGRIKE